MKIKPKFQSPSTSSLSQISNPMSYMKTMSDPAKYGMIIVFSVVLVIIILLIVYNTNTTFKTKVDSFIGTVSNGMSGMSKGGYKNKLKELEVLFFIDPSSQHCKEMFDLFKSNDLLDVIGVVDITKEDGREFAEKFGVLEKGVPNYISMKLKTGTTGVKTLDSLIDSLEHARERASQSPEAGDVNLDELTKTKNALQQLGIIFFKMDGCGHCNNFYNQLKSSGLENYFEIVDPASDLAKKYFQEFSLNPRGFPSFYSRKTGKFIEGSQPVADVVAKLS